MLLDFLKPIANKAVPHFHRSRCLRMRHRKSGCDRCQRTCRRGAIDFTRELPLDEEKCSSCFRCTAVCPTEALTCGDFDFAPLLGQMKSGGMAVIGCAASRAGIRSAIPCIGLLSAAHLTALALAGKGEIGIDIEPCAACANAEMVQVLQDRLVHLPEFLGGRIRLGADRDALPAAGRREFFSAIKSALLKEATTAIAGEEKPSVAAAYSAKQLPGIRTLLNEALQVAAPAEREGLKQAFYFDLEVDEHCTLCTACSAVCPTGGLRRKRDEAGLTLQFRSASCPGCRLCMDACRHHAVRLRAVDPQTDVFSWGTIRRENHHADHRQDAGKIPARLGSVKGNGGET